MAHQTDMHVVHQSFAREPEGDKEKVVDPACGKELERRHSKHILFRDSGTIYFCSRECREKYLSPGKAGKKAA